MAFVAGPTTISAGYGVVRGVLCLLLCLPWPAQAFDWNALWQNADQRAHAQLEQAPDAAAALFEDPAWKGVSQYRAGDYASAVEQFGQLDSPESQYNRANALARQGRYDEAIATYDEVLQRTDLAPNVLEDAAFNRDLIEKIKNQPPPQGQEGQQGESDAENPQGDAESNASENGQGQSQSTESDSTGDQAGQSDQAQPESGEQGAAHSEPTSEPEANASQGEPDEAEAEREASATGEPESDAERAESVSAAPTEKPLSEANQATEQWLRRIPDDPSGLLQRKLLQTHRNRYPTIGDSAEPW